MQHKLKSLLHKAERKRDTEGADTRFGLLPTVHGSVPAPSTTHYDQGNQPGGRSSIENKGEREITASSPTYAHEEDTQVPIRRPVEKSSGNAYDTRALDANIQDSSGHVPPVPEQGEKNWDAPVARKAVVAGKEIPDLEHSEQVDVSTRWAPAVTHERLKQTTTHITQPVIYREIHNHDIYPRIQPVLQTEILPARHFVPDPADPEGKGLLEVEGDEVPERWRRREWEWNRVLRGGGEIVTAKEGKDGHNRFEEKSSSTTGSDSSASPTSTPIPSSTFSSKPRIVDERKYTTPDGFERTETTIVHPARLEDMRDYRGPRETVHFHDRRGASWGKDEEQQQQQQQQQQRPHVDAGADYLPDVGSLSLRDETGRVPLANTAEGDKRRKETQVRSLDVKETPKGRARDSAIGVCLSEDVVRTQDFALHNRVKEVSHSSGMQGERGIDTATPPPSAVPLPPSPRQSPSPSAVPLPPSPRQSPHPSTKTESQTQSQTQTRDEANGNAHVRADADRTRHLGTDRWFPLSST
ncbi:uncharacterized protein EI97DRAFT_178316 [Westerdykella ornata]|uniref:Uncharacterized protein n=1 Tax=Westerdykella ornata TaxID=318751 RepID=A0A6A6JSC6_WESOR|nr:uncharacterized protein EI97DRAFT_178316 [Westerdykella ornata]KAF2279500.1 hypothetical protein EI97DRAFT_178316 [Westerdykella ornata]